LRKKKRGGTLSRITLGMAGDWKKKGELNLLQAEKGGFPENQCWPIEGESRMNLMPLRGGREKGGSPFFKSAREKAGGEGRGGPWQQGEHATKEMGDQ